MGRGGGGGGEQQVEVKSNNNLFARLGYCYAMVRCSSIGGPLRVISRVENNKTYERRPRPFIFIDINI